jgi:type III secretory pathway lipoprotein EscJ
MNTTIERLEQIEAERQQTMSDINFQKWMKQLNVSRLHVDKTGIVRAVEIMSQWSKDNKRGSYF